MVILQFHSYPFLIEYLNDGYALLRHDRDHRDRVDDYVQYLNDRTPAMNDHVSEHLPDAYGLLKQVD